MWRRVKDLSRDQRVALESLLGRGLADDEGLNIQPSLVLHEAPTGLDRADAWAGYLGDLDKLSARSSEASDDELDEAIDQARGNTRLSPS
jgi:hypothetical protein